MAETREKTTSRMGDLSARVEDTARGASSVAESVKDKAKDVGQAIAGVAGQVKDKAQEWASTAAEKAQDLGQSLVDFVRKYPIPTLLGAAGLGFLVAKLTSSRR
jgi:ElaB/YqjD/DUF883 family membrane-anchored ribosome-binding protein